MYSSLSLYDDDTVKLRVESNTFAIILNGIQNMRV